MLVWMSSNENIAKHVIDFHNTMKMLYHSIERIVAFFEEFVSFHLLNTNTSKIDNKEKHTFQIH